MFGLGLSWLTARLQLLTRGLRRSLYTGVARRVFHAHKAAAWLCAMSSSYQQILRRHQRDRKRRRPLRVQGTHYLHVTIGIARTMLQPFPYNPHYQADRRNHHNPCTTRSRSSHGVIPPKYTCLASAWSHFLAAQPATHDTRYLFRVQFQLIAHVSRETVELDLSTQARECSIC